MRTRQGGRGNSEEGKARRRREGGKARRRREGRREDGGREGRREDREGRRQGDTGREDLPSRQERSGHYGPWSNVMF